MRTAIVAPRIKAISPLLYGGAKRVVLTFTAERQASARDEEYEKKYSKNSENAE